MSSTPTLTAKTPSRRFLWIAGGGAAILAVVIATTGLITRSHTTSANQSWANAQAVPTVTIAQTTPEQAMTITLPGTIQPFQKAQIYARVNGYLKTWTADIGTPVKAGQTLAVIDTPDLDQQIAAAKGDLATARANAKLAALTAKRWADLKQSGAVAQQVIDEKAGDYEAKRAIVDAALAKLRGIEALAAYKRVASPFTGIVTARKTDIGALINAGSAGQELFEVADLNRLRIYVQVPQTLAAKLVVGHKTRFTLPETPGQPRDATIAAISHALDPATRTMLVQLSAPNPGMIGAGAYCQVDFDEAAGGTRGALKVPATALIVSNSGTKVAVLGANTGNKVALKAVKLGRDYGDAVDIIAGLAPGDRIIDTPPETLSNGDTVHVAPAKPQPKPQNGGQQGGQPAGQQSGGQPSGSQSSGNQGAAGGQSKPSA